MHAPLLAALVAAPLAAASPPARTFPYAVRQQVLPNGLHLVLVRTDSPGTMAYFTMFRVGSRNEVEPGRTGFAHFFEHLTFRGTKDHSARDWERITKSLGLDTNAFTDDDVTAYWVAGPSAALATLIPLEADRFRNLAYSEDDFKIESQAVLGELNKDKTSPEFKLDESLRDLAFTRHTYKHTTMGFEQDVRDMPSGFAYSNELYRRFYRPDNAYVIVVGDFDEGAVIRDVERAYGPWRGKNEPSPIPEEPAQTQQRSARVSWPVPVLPRVLSAWHTPGAADVAATAAQLVAWPYLFGKQSKLYRELVLDGQLVEEIAGDFQPHRDPYLFGVELVLRTAASEQPARAAVDRAIADLAEGRIDAKALEDVKSNLRNSLVMETDTPYRIGTWLVYMTCLTGDPEYLERAMEAVATVRAEDLSAFARAYLVRENRTTVVLAHDESPPSARASGAEERR